MSGKRGSVLRPRLVAMAGHTRQVQQQSEARRALHKGADRGAAKAQDEIPFPMARHGAIGCLRGTFANHDLRRDEGLARPRVRALGVRSARPLRKQAVSSRRNAPRP